MLTAAYDLVKEKRDVEDHASIFISYNFDPMLKCLQNISIWDMKLMLHKNSIL